MLTADPRHGTGREHPPSMGATSGAARPPSFLTRPQVTLLPARALSPTIPPVPNQDPRIQRPAPHGTRTPGAEFDAVLQGSGGSGDGSDEDADSGPLDSPERLRGYYRDMVMIRAADLEATSLQRQGQLGLWASALG